MPEDQKPTRTLETVQAEYNQLCARLGHARYNIFAIENDIKLMLDALRDLNVEAGSLKAAQETKVEGA